MNIHEYQGKEIFQAYDIPVDDQAIATTPEQARAAAERMGTTVVIKAQVLVGGRGKAGGVKVAKTPDEAEERAKEILANLEEGEFGEQGQPRIARRRGRKGGADRSQLELFQGVEGRRSKVEGRMESGASPDI